MRLDFPKDDHPKRVRRGSLEPGDLFTHNEPGEWENPTVWFLMDDYGTSVDLETGRSGFCSSDTLVYKLDGVLRISYSRG